MVEGEGEVSSNRLSGGKTTWARSLCPRCRECTMTLRAEERGGCEGICKVVSGREIRQQLKTSYNSTMPLDWSSKHSAS